MKTTMSLKRIRIAPRKMRMVVDLVRGKRVAVAKDMLRFSKNRGARILSKLLDSAISCAKTLGQGNESNLVVLKIAVDEGPKLKRWRARARGSAYPIQKKVSRITLILDEVKDEKSAHVASTVTVRRDGKTTNAINIDKPKFRASAPVLFQKPGIRRGIQRFFRRKAI